MRKAVIFGAGGTGRRVYRMVRDYEDVVAFADNDSCKWGGGTARALL